MYTALVETHPLVGSIDDSITLPFCQIACVTRVGGAASNRHFVGFQGGWLTRGCTRNVQSGARVAIW